MNLVFIKKVNFKIRKSKVEIFVMLVFCLCFLVMYKLCLLVNMYFLNFYLLLFILYLLVYLCEGVRIEIGVKESGELLCGIGY